MPWWLGKVRFSPLIRYGSSAPFNLGTGGLDRNLDDLSNDRPNFTGSTNDIVWRVRGSMPFPVELRDRLSLAPLGSPGDLPRNAGHGPRLFQFNMNLSRQWKFHERYKLRPSLEVTNPLNINNFSFGSNFIDFQNVGTCTATGPQVTACETFLAPSRTMTHRRMRVGLRFDF